MNPPRRTGHDGPYGAPFRTDWRTVPADWLDYNGHMNVAYYTMAFDQAIDDMLHAELGIGESHVVASRQGPYALQASLQYLDEMLEGDDYQISVQMIDCDEKRMHLYLELRKSPDQLAATCEELLMNVDLETRRSAPYPNWAARRINQMMSDHCTALHRPASLGQPIGIRRKPTS